MELIRIADGKFGFGDYALAEKSKLSDVSYQGDLYKVKTYAEITKLEKNGAFLYESVPGTTVENFKETATGMTFEVEGVANTQITLGLEEEKIYKVSVDGNGLGEVATNVGGKLSISLDLAQGVTKSVVVERV